MTALNQQASGRGPQGEFSLSMSESIWNTLKLVISLLDRNDLMEDVNKRYLLTSLIYFELNIKIFVLKKEEAKTIKPAASKINSFYLYCHKSYKYQEHVSV